MIVLLPLDGTLVAKGEFDAASAGSIVTFRTKIAKSGFAEGGLVTTRVSTDDPHVYDFNTLAPLLAVKLTMQDVRPRLE